MPQENNQNFNQSMPQQPQKSGSGLNTILLIILIALVGFGIWFLSQKNEAMPINEVTNNKSFETLEANNVESGNELFNWIDTFTADKDMGTPRILVMAPEYGLILLEYPTSQEGSSMAVFNYKNNKLIKNIGNAYESGGAYPVAFVGRDKILVFSFSESAEGVLTIQDFESKIIKTLIEDVEYKDVYPKYGKELYIRAKNQTYTLNTETLELSN
jgi:hypothetical protein